MVDLVGDDGPNALSGTSAGDSIVGGGGNDVIYGAGGVDYLSGGDGDDLIGFGPAGRGQIHGGNGNDTLTNALLNGAIIDTTAAGGEGYFDGGDGFDHLILVYTGAPHRVWFDATKADNQIVFGSAGYHIQNVERFTVYGGADTDTLFGGSGDDSFFGGAGHDTVAGGTGRNLLNGGEGIDQADYLNAAIGVSVDLTVNGQPYTGWGFDTLIDIEGLRGSNHADRLYGSAGDNFFTGEGGDDFIDGRGGHDICHVNVASTEATWKQNPDGSWVITSAQGVDTLFNVERVVFTDNVQLALVNTPRPIEGTAGSDVLIGAAGNDILRGNAGDDTIIGLDGADSMYGGLGVDTVQFAFRLAEGGVASYGPGMFVGGEGSLDWVFQFERYLFEDGVVDVMDDNRLVDDMYYYGTQNDVWRAGADADAHFMAHGWREGRNPNAWFDVKGYLNAYADARQAADQGMDPLTHYLTIGWKKGYDPSVKFDTTMYLSGYQDVAAAGLNPLAHFIVNGIDEGRIAPFDGVFD